MTLLEDIQNSAVDAKSDLATLLRKCKLLAVRLGSQPLEDWLIWESNGYPNHVPVPEYRIWPLEVFGHFSALIGHGDQTVPIPLTALKFIPEDVKQSYDRYECRDSVASIEIILSNVSGNVQVSTSHLAVAIGTKLYKDYNCVQAWAEYHPSRLVELLNSVRNRILDFSLAVWKEAPNAGEIGSGAYTNLEPKKVTQIFNTTVYGGAANLVDTANDSSVAFTIGAKDFTALSRVLAEKGVSSVDITELEQAVEDGFRAVNACELWSEGVFLDRENG